MRTMSFANQILAVMERRKTSQKWLASQAGLDRATVSRMLSKPATGTVDSWERVAAALDMRWELVPRGTEPDTID